MYINPFVAGILATLLAEVVALIGFTIYSINKDNNGGKR